VSLARPLTPEWEEEAPQQGEVIYDEAMEEYIPPTPEMAACVTIMSELMDKVHQTQLRPFYDGPSGDSGGSCTCLSKREAGHTTLFLARVCVSQLTAPDAAVQSNLYAGQYESITAFVSDVRTIGAHGCQQS
jgi:hypothetical protein